MTGAEQATLLRVWEVLGGVDAKLDLVTHKVDGVDDRLRVLEVQSSNARAVEEDHAQARAIIATARVDRSVSKRWIIQLVVGTVISVMGLSIAIMKFFQV